MKKSYILLAIALVAIGIGSAFAFTTYMRGGAEAPTQPLAENGANPSNGSETNTVADDKGGEREEDRDVRGEDDAPTPVVDVPASQTEKRYSMADVATHTGEASCWTAVRGNVYDVTNWVPDHPGGRRAILSLCGKDGTSAFEGKHGGQDSPEAQLAKFKIGALAQ